MQTQVNVGTTFTIYLPALSASDLPAASPAATAPGAIPHGHGEYLLVVEDEKIVRQALVEGLTSLNYRVIQATNGEEALRQLATHSDQVALILSDLVMPVMGGARLFQILQQQGSTIPIVILSGHPMDQARENLQTACVTGWLSKPPNLEDLARVVAKAVTAAPVPS